MRGCVGNAGVPALDELLDQLSDRSRVIVSLLLGSASDSRPGACVLVGVLLVLHSRIVIFSYMNFLDEVLSGACGLMLSVLRGVRVLTWSGTLKSSSSSANAVVSLVYPSTRWLADRRTCREGASHSSGSRATLSLASFLSRNFCCCLCSHVRPEFVSTLLPSDLLGSLRIVLTSCHSVVLLERHVPFSLFLALLGGRSIHSASPFNHFPLLTGTAGGGIVVVVVVVMSS